MVTCGYRNCFKYALTPIFLTSNLKPVVIPGGTFDNVEVFFVSMDLYTPGEL